MQRLPIVIFNNLQLTTAVGGATSAALPNEFITISAASVNNTSGGAVNMDAYIVPTGGTASSANQIITGLSIPASGSAPTVLAALIGQTIPKGGTLQMKAASGAALSPFVSGYQTTP